MVGGNVYFHPSKIAPSCSSNSIQVLFLDTIKIDEYEFFQPLPGEGFTDETAHRAQANHCHAKAIDGRVPNASPYTDCPLLLLSGASSGAKTWMESYLQSITNNTD